MVYTCYAGFVFGLLALAGWRKRLKCGELQIGSFWEFWGLIPT